MSFANVNSLAGKLLITGDLNVHFYRPLAPDYVTGRVLDLQLFDLSRAMEGSTDRYGHMLDLAFHRG